MTIGNDLGSRLDSWMRQDAHPPDDLAAVLAVIAVQRPHRVAGCGQVETVTRQYVGPNLHARCRID